MSPAVSIPMDRLMTLRRSTSWVVSSAIESSYDAGRLPSLGELAANVWPS
jgi:hypothetical protein